MTAEQAQKAIIAVLNEIQERSGLPCPTLNGTDVPPKVLQDFDSTVWPAATTKIAKKLGVLIPKNVHIFGGEKGKPLLSISQIADLIVKKHLHKPSMKAAA